MTGYLNMSLSNDTGINNSILAVCKDITEHYNTLVPNRPALGKKPLHIIYNLSTPVASLRVLFCTIAYNIELATYPSTISSLSF
jgi:hypothetical protein